MSREEADKELAGREKGTFMVRFSDTRAGQVSFFVVNGS